MFRRIPWLSLLHVPGKIQLVLVVVSYCEGVAYLHDRHRSLDCVSLGLCQWHAIVDQGEINGGW